MSKPPLHVVAGLIHDSQQRVLVQQRTEPAHFKGLWEFPGGKVEVGESAERALRRELEEELGLLEAQSVAWMRLLHDYALDENTPTKNQPATLPRILLDIRKVTSFAGDAHSREGQHFEWVSVQRLGELRCLAANRPVVEALQRSFSIRQNERGDE